METEIATALVEMGVSIGTGIGWAGFWIMLGLLAVSNR